jgi:hypothetical protein
MEDFDDNVTTLKGLGILFVHMITLKKDVKKNFCRGKFYTSKTVSGLIQ